jgi:hypothetical protein
MTDFYIEIPYESMIVQEPWEMEMAGHVLGKLMKELDWQFDIYNHDDVEQECYVFAGKNAPVEIASVIEAMAQGLSVGPLLEHILKKRTETNDEASIPGHRDDEPGRPDGGDLGSGSDSS